MRNSILLLNGYIFVHGGLKSRYLFEAQKSYKLPTFDQVITKMNQQIQLYLLGKRRFPSWADGRDIRGVYDNPFWYRGLSKNNPNEERFNCMDLEVVLKTLDAKAMIVGHSIQMDGINSGCRGRVYRIDVGLAQGFYLEKEGKFYAHEKPPTIGMAELLKINPDGTIMVIR